MKNVLITGSSRGIGQAISSLLKNDNYHIITPTRQELDLSKASSIEAYVRNNKNLKLYALINNAGVNNPQWIDELDDQNIFETIQVNLIAPILLVRGFVPLMMRNRISHIINISSMFGVVARGKQVLYTASKFGLNGITKALALELAKNNILVNSICPGFVVTDLTRRNSAQKNKKLASDVPLKRFAKAEEIAYLVEFIISEKNTYITGQSIVIDGGYTAK